MRDFEGDELPYCKLECIERIIRLYNFCLWINYRLMSIYTNSQCTKLQTETAIADDILIQISGFDSKLWSKVNFFEFHRIVNRIFLIKKVVEVVLKPTRSYETNYQRSTNDPAFPVLYLIMCNNSAKVVQAKIYSSKECR